MLRIIILLFTIGGGYFTVFPAKADSCGFVGGSYVYLNVPQMAIPADTPDGTVLYTSHKINKKLICEAGVYSSIPKSVSVVTTADYDNFLKLNNGIRFTVYVDGIAFDGRKSQVLGYTSTGSNPSFSKDISIWYEITVDSSRGKIPISGTMLSGGFESFFIMLAGNYSFPRGVISLSTPNITYIPCTMDISVTPDSISFGATSVSDLEKGTQVQRKFSTLIRKNKGCMLAVSAPFGINMFFEPTNPIMNADGSLSLNNGLGLTISDTTGKQVAYNTAWKIDDVKVQSVLTNYFIANLKKVSGQDVKTGPFSADVVVRLNYY